MPEHYRALVVVLFLAAVAFGLAKVPACATAMNAADFQRRRNLWFAVTLAAFLSHGFWIYTGIAAVLLMLAQAREQNKLAMFLVVLLATPPISAQIGGLGVIEHFFTINHFRLLSLVMLLPAFLVLRAQPGVDRFGSLLPDKLIIGYLVLSFVLQMRVDTLTNTIRIGAFYAFIDVFLPYYVASRSLNSLGRFREALMAFALAGLVLAAIGAFEFMKQWLLYSALPRAMDVPATVGGYLRREGGGLGSLRAVGSAGHPIVLGYFMAIALGFFLYLKRLVPGSLAGTLGILALLAGLVASMSRGPWVGAAVMVVVFIALGPNPVRGLLKLGLLCAVLVPVLMALPGGAKLIDLLPLVGQAEQENVSYRVLLLQVSLDVMMKNPLLGSHDFVHAPEMQVLMQGDGIIDVVNSYVGIVLASGFVGLALFGAFFAAVAFGIWSGIRKVPDRDDERHVLGRALLATLLGMLVIIFTVSSIFLVPVMYWIVGGLGVAYARMLAPVSAAANNRRYSGRRMAAPARRGYAK